MCYGPALPVPEGGRGGQIAEGLVEDLEEVVEGLFSPLPIPKRRRFQATKVMEASFDVEDAMISIVIIYYVA